MPKFRHALIASIPMLLAACTSAGVRFAQTHIPQIKVPPENQALYEIALADCRLIASEVARKADSRNRWSFVRGITNTALALATAKHADSINEVATQVKGLPTADDYAKSFLSGSPGKKVNAPKVVRKVLLRCLKDTSQDDKLWRVPSWYHNLLGITPSPR